MPRTVEVTTENGRPVIVRNVPDDMSDNEVRMKVFRKETQGKTRAVSTGLVQGASFGMLEGPEPEALLKGLYDSLLTGEDFSKAFTRNMQDISRANAEFEGQDPVASNRAELGGNLAAGGAVGALTFSLARSLAGLAKKIGPRKVAEVLADSKIPGASTVVKQVEKVVRSKGAQKAAEKAAESKAAQAASKAENVPEAFRAPLRAVKTPKAARTLSDLKQGLSQAQKRDVDMFVRRLKSFDTKTRGLPPSRSMNAEELAQTKAFVDRLKGFPANLNP